MADDLKPGTEPAWLTSDERAAWLALVGMVVQLPKALDAQLERDAGLSFYEYMVMAMLSEQPDRTLRMSRLADLTNGSLSRLSHVATRLEQAGWIRREQCREDGRATNAILTEDGFATVVASAPGHVRAVRALVVGALAPEQLGQLRDIGDLILARVDEDSAGCSPAA
jgi:DNA-binding MarR family transcriptional regulator